MTENTVKKEYKPWQYKPGESGNPAGKPKGTISLLQDIKRRLTKMAKEEPDEYATLIDSYWKDKKMRQFLLEMIDGRPKQQLEVSGTLDTRLEVLNRMGLLDETEAKRIEEQTSSDS